MEYLVAYTTELPLVVFSHPLRLAGGCFDEELLGCVEDDVVLLVGGDESASDGRNAGRDGGSLRKLHGSGACACSGKETMFGRVVSGVV